MRDARRRHHPCAHAGFRRLLKKGLHRIALRAFAIGALRILIETDHASLGFNPLMIAVIAPAESGTC